MVLSKLLPVPTPSRACASLTPPGGGGGGGGSQLTDARVDERFAKGEEEKRKVVDYLCQTFAGVRGRVMDLCKVKQRTHELAITVVMESNMDSIVVEREETAKR